MAYAVSREGRYARNVPPGLAHVRWATSTDGLTFTPRGVAVKSRTKQLLGNARSPEFFGRHLSFHSLTGIFRVTWTGNGFTPRPTKELSACYHPERGFRWTPPPADPTLARIGGTTTLFHNDHTRGIFRTVRKSGARACFEGLFVAQ